MMTGMMVMERVIIDIIKMNESKFSVQLVYRAWLLPAAWRWDYLLH